MMQLAIEEPRIEQYFNHSQDDILKALRFIVENNIKDYEVEYIGFELSSKQKKELDERIASFHDNPSMGRSWSEIKRELSR